MRYGIDLMHFAEYLAPQVVIPLAQETEAARWEALFLWGHLGFVWGPPSGDPWLLLARVAAHIERLKPGTSVSPLPRYAPHPHALALTTLDRLSAGRVILGVGLGGVAAEHTAFGASASPKQLGKMADKGLEVLARLWPGAEVDHHGDYYHIEHMQLQPVQGQRPCTPIWDGGERRAALRRAARWDGWIASGNGPDGAMTKSPEDMERYITRLRHQALFTVALADYSQPRAAALVQAYAAAGVTWWLESLHGDRGTGDEALARRRAGPPHVWSAP
jgi:alkanesulfonate monooxygenase SsuD/methylene tetrahydromethanopterin reductase-like flavin-dependent oxidoreductase (luciferase family)